MHKLAMAARHGSGSTQRRDRALLRLLLLTAAAATVAATDTWAVPTPPLPTYPCPQTPLPDTSGCGRGRSQHPPLPLPCALTCVDRSCHSAACSSRPPTTAPWRLNTSTRGTNPQVPDYLCESQIQEGRRRRQRGPAVPHTGGCLADSAKVQPADSRNPHPVCKGGSAYLAHAE